MAKRIIYLCIFIFICWYSYIRLFTYNLYFPDGSLKEHGHKKPGTGRGLILDLGYWDNAIVKNGLVEEYANGKLEFKAHYTNNVLDGLKTVYSPAGRIIDQWEYTSGVPADGVRKVIWPNGNVKSIVTYKSGKVDGELIQYSENGLVLEDWNYKLGVPVDGLKKTIYSNGELAKIETYKNGIRIGEEKRWNEKGELTFKCTWENGKWEGEVVVSDYSLTYPRESIITIHAGVRTKIVEFIDGKIKRIISYSPVLRKGEIEYFGDAVNNFGPVYFKGTDCEQMKDGIYQKDFDEELPD